MNPAELPLRDIHLPAPVSAWPPGLGWYLLILLLGCIVFGIWWWLRYQQQTAWKKNALNEFNNIRLTFEQTQNRQQLAANLSALLRRTALYLYPTEKVARLQGQAWLNFLNHVHPSFDAELTDAILSAPYAPRPEFDAKKFLDACDHWINQLPKRRSNP